jgi:ubiquinone/menaquinone biosynthesis C-methylase UbiE
MIPENPKLQFLNDELVELHLSAQFHWTKKLREMIYNKIRIDSKKKVLDVGCGTGLITGEMEKLCGGEVYGVDINEKLLEKAVINSPRCRFETGTVEKLSFDDDFFDVTFCHFLLMWVKKPADAIMEMIRVTKPGGYVVCAAEPDYGGKIDYPDTFASVTSMINFLQGEGADPFFGRKLKALFAGYGMNAEIGVFTDLWDDEVMKREFRFIWDFNLRMAETDVHREFIEELKQKDMQALERGEKVTLLPIFWAIAGK